ncbi:hypothetical protein SAMN05216244_2193 [Sediminibacillus halophilus]|uniref:Uncharacterized protein n=1 Tax=Sediminibacillus halophilus TaxID=482461 RepID=A0A1G9RY03_9BACI|nr:hypothetical protein SAMN05216244_2193 [Sediminibacillus halophilus]
MNKPTKYIIEKRMQGITDEAKRLRSLSYEWDGLKNR